MEQSEDEEDDDDEDIQVGDDEDNAQDGDDDGDDDEDETLVFAAGENMEHDEMEEDGGDDEDDEDDNLIQADQQEEDLPSGEFEMVADSLVNEDQAMEMEALMYQYKPHNVETLALNENDEEEKHEADDENDDSGEEGEDKDDAPEDESNIQLSADDSKFFSAGMNGHGGLGESVYERVIPAKYADDGDAFMASMIENYALEQKNEDGSPNGKFFMDEATTRSAASEVLKTHKKLEGKENDEYLKQYFERTWKHFDVTHDGLVEVDVMP